MLRSKFLDIVKTFSPDELKGFRNFVRSPFHNTNKNVVRVFEIVRTNYPDFKDTRLTKEYVFTKIYPGKSYNYNLMRILLSDLLKLAEEYLAYKNFIRTPFAEKQFLLKELDKRKLYVLFNRNLKSAKDLLRSTSINKDSIDVKYFLNLYDIESIEIDNMISRNLQPESGEYVLRQGEYLINFFIINIFHIAHEISSHKEVLNVNFDHNIVDNFLQSLGIKNFISALEKKRYKYLPILLIYYNMYLSCRNNDKEEIYFRLKKLIFENLTLFSREEKFNLFIVLESICTPIISGNKKHNYELMEVYKKMLDENIYIHSGEECFQLNLFRNIFYTAIAIKEFKWAEDFI